MTVIMGYANDNNMYIPSIDSFEYEAYENDQCRYEPGTGEMLAETLLNIKDKLLELSGKREEIHNYDRQMTIIGG